MKRRFWILIALTITVVTGITSPAGYAAAPNVHAMASAGDPPISGPAR